MIGPTGVGKTEIARRLANLAQSPFLKVEASKFTEVGYVGRDVESMIRDLTELAINMVKQENSKEVEKKAREMSEEYLLDLLLPPRPSAGKYQDRAMAMASAGSEEDTAQETESAEQRTREKFRAMLHEGKFEDRLVDMEVEQSQKMPFVEIFPGGGFEDMGSNLKDVFGKMFPKKSQRRKLKVREAREIIIKVETEKLIDMDEVVKEAIRRTEQSGIIFLDEIDKIASRNSGSHGGAEVSREGVQRDLLPIVEGSTVTTKHGMVQTDHILFIASGAFHTAKPSDIIPELQGRFPLRVELNSLGEEEFYKILTEPQNALILQYIALMATEGVTLRFDDDAIREMAKIAAEVNQKTEDIGARRLHTVMEKMLEELSFIATDLTDKEFIVTRAACRHFPGRRFEQIYSIRK